MRCHCCVLQVQVLRRSFLRRHRPAEHEQAHEQQQEEFGFRFQLGVGGLGQQQEDFGFQFQFGVGGLGAQHGRKLHEGTRDHNCAIHQYY